MSRVLQVTGVALLLGSILLLNYLVFDLGRYGTCASGGPYVVARQCEEGFELKLLGTFGAIFAMLAGGAMARSGRICVTAWAMLFLSLAATSVLIGFGPAAPEQGDIQLTSVILGVVFFVMGAPALLAVAAPAQTGGLFGEQARDALADAKRARRGPSS